jgi:hypothetical protein
MRRQLYTIKPFWRECSRKLMKENIFQYNEKYIKEYPKQFLTFTMPASLTLYTDKRLFPFLKD